MKRTGLHKLTCSDPCCPCTAYSTIAAMERHPLPRCGRCGETLIPERLEVAMAVLPAELLAEHPRYVAWQHELNRVSHGQAPHGRNGRTVRAVEDVATERIRRWENQAARAAQLAAIRPAPEPIPF